MLIVLAAGSLIAATAVAAEAVRAMCSRRLASPLPVRAAVREVVVGEIEPARVSAE